MLLLAPSVCITSVEHTFGPATAGTCQAGRRFVSCLQLGLNFLVQAWLSFVCGPAGVTLRQSAGDRHDAARFATFAGAPAAWWYSCGHLINTHAKCVSGCACSCAPDGR